MLTKPFKWAVGDRDGTSLPCRSAQTRDRASRDEGLSARAAAQRFGGGVTTAIIWIRRFKQQSEALPRRQGAAHASRLEPHRPFILGLIEQRKDITLAEIAELLRSERDVRVGVTTVWY